MAAVDRFLFHSFAAAEELARRDADETKSPRPEIIVLPMLLRVSDPSWDHSKVPDCVVTSRLGDIVSCRGSMRSLDALQGDPAVVSIEASRRSSGWTCRRSVPFIHADVVHAQGIEEGDGAIVAVIDSGIDVLHEA